MPRPIDSGLTDWMNDTTRDNYRVVMATLDSFLAGTETFGFRRFTNVPYLGLYSGNTIDAGNIIEGEAVIVKMPSIDIAIDSAVSVGDMDIYSEDNLVPLQNQYVGSKLRITIGDVTWPFLSEHYHLYTAYITGLRPIRRNIYRLDLVVSLNLINAPMNTLVALQPGVPNAQTFTGTARSILRDIWENYTGQTTASNIGPRFHSSVPTALSNVNMEITAGPYGSTETFYDLSQRVKSVLPGVEIRNILNTGGSSLVWEFYVPDHFAPEHFIRENEILDDSLTSVAYTPLKRFVRVFYGSGPLEYKQAETGFNHMQPFMPRSIRDLEINDPPLPLGAGYTHHQTLADNYADFHSKNLVTWQLKVDAARIPYMPMGTVLRVLDGSRVVAGHVSRINYTPLTDYTIEMISYE